MKKLVLFLLTGVCVAQFNVARMLSGVNIQSGTSYTFQPIDATRVTAFTSSVSVAATLPCGSTFGFGAGRLFSVQNQGAGTVSISVSGCSIISSATSGSSLVLASGEWADIYSSGSDFYVAFSGSGGGGGGGGANITVNGGIALSSPVNFQNGTSVNGITLQAQNPSGSNVQFQLSGTLNNSGLTNPFTTINGQTCTLGSPCTVSGGTNTQTGNYTLTASDLGKLVVMNCSTTCTVSLFGSPSSGYFGAIESIGSTTATVNLNGKTFNGSSSVPVLVGFLPVRFWSDGTNYFGDPPLVAGTNVTFSAAANGLTVNSTGSGTSGPTLETNGVNNSSQTALNFQNPSAFNGLSFTFSNPSGANETFAVGGSLNNAGLTNSSLTFNGTTVSLGGSGTIPFQTNGVTNTSQSGLNFVNPSSFNGLSFAFTNPTGSQESFSVSGTLNNSGLANSSIPINTTTCTLGSACTVNPVISVTNAGTTGTSTSHLAKLTGAPSTAVSTATTDTTGAVGICISGCSTSGTAVIQTSGLVNCAFSNATTAGHYVQISGTTSGDCADTGAATFPTSGQVIGRVLSTNGSAGTFQIDLFPSEIGSASGGGGGSSAGSQFSFQYNSNGTGGFAGVGPASAPGSVPQYAVSIPTSGGSPAAPQLLLPGIGGRAITGTTATDTILSTDCSPKRVDYIGSVAVAVTLPTATTLAVPNCVFRLVNELSTNNDVTITPTTWTIDGASSLAVHQGQIVTVYVDSNSATNWKADVQETGVVAGSHVSLTRAANSLTITGDGDAATVNGAAVPASQTVVGTNSSRQIVGSTVQGNGTKVQLSTGTTTTNDCVKFDANGNTVDAGAGCASSGYSTIDSNGSAITQRATVNFISGTNATVSCVDNAGSTRSDCTISASAAAGSRLDQITAATGANSINNGDNAQTWNFSLTTASKKAFTFTENTASTATGTPILVNVATLSTSTANPFQVTAGGTVNGVKVDTTGLLGPIGTGGINATQVNGAAPATSASYAATNGSGQIVAATTPVTSIAGTSNEISMSASTGSVTASLATAARTRSCEIVIGGTGTSNVLQSGDDTIANNSCFNKTGVTETITAVYCKGDVASDTVTVNPTFGSAGTGTTILSGALTCGSSEAYSSTGTVSNASLADGNGIDLGMGGTLNAHDIHVLIVYTMP